ncbi:MAG: SUMF1/EgtB/PvdO family nonheme iron enzyme, partial [Planctomycetaceae bacterium]
LQEAGFVLPHNGWREWISAECPQHRVRITKPFYLGLCSVTRAQFAAFVRATAYRSDAEAVGKGGWGYVQALKNGAQRPDFNWKQTGFDQSDNHPV